MKSSKLIIIFILPALLFATDKQTFEEMVNELIRETVPAVKVTDLAEIGEVLYLDAREKAEYKVSHIKDAEWIGYKTFELKKYKDLPKDKTLIIYCSVGYRSEKIGEKLKKAGYLKVYNLYGGIFAWKNSGRKVYDMSGKETEKVHPYDEVWGRWLTSGVKAYSASPEP